MRGIHHQIYARDGVRYDYADDETTSYYVTYNKDRDVLEVTRNTDNKENPVEQVAEFYGAVRYLMEPIHD